MRAEAVFACVSAGLNQTVSFLKVKEEMTDRYREITVAGSYAAMGQQIGEAAREEIRGFVAMAYERISQTIRVARPTIQKVVTQSTAFLERYSPDLLAELRGMAEGSGVSEEDLMFLQIRNQLTADMDSGCTSVSIGTAMSATGSPLIAQNWDNDPALDAFTIVLTRRPATAPAFMTITQAGLIAYIGVSELGIAACLNSLPAPSRAVGVPHYFTLRRLFEGRSLDEAVHAIDSAYRAIPASIMLATPQGPANLEVTIDAVHVLRPDGQDWQMHTNHCLHPELAAVNDRFAELIQSRPRLDRINRLLQLGRPLQASDLKMALADHDGYPQSLCRHANDHSQHGYWATVFSVIMNIESWEMEICRGTPCCHEYQIYRPG